MSTTRHRKEARKSILHARRHAPVMGVFLLMWVLGGCGGSGKKAAEEPDTDDTAAETEPASEGDELIPAEKLDAIQRFFEHKRRIVTHCFTDAMDAGEVAKNAPGGHVTITMTITPGGKLTSIKATEVKPSSQTLERCVIDMARKWTVTSLPKSLDYSFTFGFGTL